MSLIAAMLLSQAAAAGQPPVPQAPGTRVMAMARVEILGVGRAGPAESPESQHRIIRQERGATMTVFE